MTTELLRLNLQYFSDDDSIETEGEAELVAAIKGLLESEEQGDDDLLDDIDQTDESDDDDQDDVGDTDDGLGDDDTDADEDQDDEQYDELDKKVQTPEENARFAQQRREREAQERAQRELDRLKQESPEFKLAKMLSEQSGQSVEEIMERIQEEQLKQQAKVENVPVEVLKKQRETEERANRLEQEISMLKFQNWQTQIKSDGERLMQEYTMLTQEDIQKATDYILHTARNVELPLEDAVFAVHGKKIVEALAKNKVQDELASQSGRKRKTPLAPNNTKPPKVVSLTAEEKIAARAFGMTDEEYIKYK